MGASRQEVQALADQILELLGVRISNGSLTLHYHEGVLQRIESGNVFRLKPGEEQRLDVVVLDRRGPSRRP